MAKSVCLFFCVCLSVSFSVGQYGYENERTQRRYPSFFGIPQNLINVLPDNIRNIPSRLTSLVYRPVITPENQKNQYDRGPNLNQNGNPNWNTNYDQPNQNWNENGIPVNQNYQNGNPYNQVYPNWNKNPAEPNWNQNGIPVNPNSYDNQNQNYQNGNQNNDNQVNPNQFDSNERPSNNQLNIYSTQPPVNIEEANIPNDYVNFDDRGTTSKPIIAEEAQGKNNEAVEVVSTEKPEFEDRHGDDEITTQAPVTHLQPLTPVNSRDSVSFAAFQDSCTPVEGGTGSCIPIFSCPQYARLISQARSSPDAVQLLRRVHCGFQGSTPKVCCPARSIPTNPPATTTTTQASAREVDDIMLQPPQCGVSNATSSRVVGGAPARLADFPWMALLGYKPRRGDDPRWLCGGSLISARHVLTAAHCIHGHEEDLYQVRLGELDLARDDDGATPTDVPIKLKVKHEQYDAKSFTNDIGLLLLARSVEFTFLIRPICIPQDRELRARSFENYTPTIAGWGDTEFRGPAATHLQALQLPVVSNEFCANAYKAYKAQVIDERVLCAGYKKGGHDACQGDSGGPLMQPIWMPREHVTYFYQIGVVSYGKKCAEAGFPGVYTRVTKFVPWIQENLAKTQNL